MTSNVVKLADHYAPDEPAHPLTWFIFWLDDWVGGVKKLTLEQEAAYLRVCLAIYHEGKPIDDDDGIMSRECRVSARKWRSLKAELVKHEKIAIRDGKIHQGKCAVVIRKAREANQKQVESGSFGGRKSAENRRKALGKAKPDQGTLEAASSILKTSIHSTTYCGAEAPISGGPEVKPENPAPPLPASDLPAQAPASPADLLWSDKPGGGISFLVQMGEDRRAAGGMVTTWLSPKAFPGKHSEIMRAISLCWAEHQHQPVGHVRSRVRHHLNSICGSPGGPNFNPEVI